MVSCPPTNHHCPHPSPEKDQIFIQVECTQTWGHCIGEKVEKCKGFQASMLALLSFSQGVVLSSFNLGYSTDLLSLYTWSQQGRRMFFHQCSPLLYKLNSNVVIFVATVSAFMRNEWWRWWLTVMEKSSIRDSENLDPCSPSPDNLQLIPRFQSLQRACPYWCSILCQSLKNILIIGVSCKDPPWPLLFYYLRNFRGFNSF